MANNETWFSLITKPTYYGRAQNLKPLKIFHSSCI